MKRFLLSLVALFFLFSCEKNTYVEETAELPKVLEITADETISTTPWVEVSDPSQVDGVLSALQPARVKWFDQAKGFGFANLFGNSADVFLHIEVLRRSGLTDLQPGEALALRTVSGKRGLMATDVKPWESAVEH